MKSMQLLGEFCEKFKSIENTCEIYLCSSDFNKVPGRQLILRPNVPQFTKVVLLIVR